MANDTKISQGWQVSLSGEEVDELYSLVGQVSLVTSCMASASDGVDLTSDATSSLVLILDHLRSTVSDILKRAMQKEEVRHA